VTPLLMLCGTDDEPAYKETVALAAMQAYKEYEFISYKSAGHGFTGNDQIEAMQQSQRFLSARLKP
jgi:dienelactone hydrolase